MIIIWTQKSIYIEYVNRIQIIEITWILIKDDTAFCEYLLEEAGVAVVPGAAFGKKGFFRISYATSDKLLIEAGSRIKVACNKLS